VRRILRIAGLLVFLFCAFSVTAYLIKPKEVKRFVARNVFGIKCIDYKQPVYSKKLTNKIPEYIENSKARGIKQCKDEKEILAKASEGKLVKVKDGNAFIVESMSHSYPYLTKPAKDLLIEIGVRFREKIKNSRVSGAQFRVTSMTRTAEKLKKLRTTNSNASMNSPHLYGNAFDISYINFKTNEFFVTNCDDKYLMEALAEVIWQLRKEKKCWATFERQQNCYHVVER